MIFQTLKGSYDRPRITLILKGGLGNQLFSYAAARRLALVNGVDLVLDNISGFKNDFYGRTYCLNHFNIPQNLISPQESFKHLGKYGRTLLGRLYYLLPLERRPFVLEEETGFDQRIYNLKITRPVFLEGYLHSKKYFADIEDVIRSEFQIISAHEPKNLELASKIGGVESVCLHVRRFDMAPHKNGSRPLKHASLSAAYFTKAMEIVTAKVERPHFFVFSDYPTWAEHNLTFRHPVTFIKHSESDAKDYEDLWLMSLCKHFIIANSTFSWWGAWLSSNKKKVVVAPVQKYWNVRHAPENLILDSWIGI